MKAEYPEKYRVKNTHYQSNTGDKCGAFQIPYIKGKKKEILQVIVGVGLGWEHVSVSLPHRCPTWEEMDFIKNKFWHDDEVVMQLHVAAKNHVNIHPFCLHLWRPLNATIPLPAIEMV